MEYKINQFYKDLKDFSSNDGNKILIAARNIENLAHFFHNIFIQYASSSVCTVFFLY